MKVLTLVPMSKAQTMPPVLRQIESLRQIDIDVDVLPIEGAPVLKYLHALPAVVRRSRSADLVHGHYGYCGWLSRLQLGRPVVVSFMGDDLLGTPGWNGELSCFSKLVVRLNRRLAQLVDCVIVKSPEMAQVVAPVEARVVPNGVDMENFRPLERDVARRQLGWRLDARYVLFGGNPGNPRKAFPLAQEAVARAAARGGAIELEPLWGVRADEVPVLMSAADVLLLTSHVEGSPNVVKEAMSCRLPVVSVRVGDVKRLLEDVRASYVCGRDPDELATALGAALNGGRTNGREALRAQGLDLPSVAQRLATIYGVVLQRRSREAAKPTRARRCAGSLE
jgi:glycosyltransferase involved in cell wall biosynthesis